MPQMAPLNWLSLLISFILIMVMFNILNYYSFSQMIKQKSHKSIKIKNINWKW